MSKELVVRTPTQAIYDAVVAQAVADGNRPMSKNLWYVHKEDTCIWIDTHLTYSELEYFKRDTGRYKLIDAKDYLEERTMENLQAGDILVNDRYSYDYEVQGVIGKVVIHAQADKSEYAGIDSVTELENAGWKLKDSDPEIIELTLAEVAERLNIPKLRIKE